MQAAPGSGRLAQRGALCYTLAMSKVRANSLNGSDWLRYSISVWDDIRKTAEEAALNHPALFPTMLVDRLLSCLVHESDQVVLDPFCGSGSTLLAACARNLRPVGLDLSSEYIALSRRRLTEAGYLESTIQEGRLREPDYVLLQADARQLNTWLGRGSADICITSPPYWDILRQKRTADGKSIRHYGDREADLGEIQAYDGFLASLSEVFAGCWRALRPGAYCCVIVMDLRKGARFFPLHQDVADRMGEIGFVLDDMIIWDRRSEYNNLRPLGYPYKFRINKVHEFILIFEKPPAPVSR